MGKKRLISALVFAAGLAVCTAVRTAAVFHTDLLLGNMQHGYALPFNLAYYGLITAFSVVLAFLAMPKSKERKDFKFSDNGILAVGFGMIALAVGAAYDAIIMHSTMGSSKVFMVIGAVFAVIFAAIGLVTLYKKEITSFIGFAYSLGGIYFVLRGIHNMMIRMAVASIPEYVIETLACVLGGLFFITLGKILIGYEEKNTRRLLCLWGTSASMLSLSAFLGALAAKLILPEGSAWRIVMSVKESTAYFQSVCGADGYLLSIPSFSNIALGLISAAAVVCVILGRQKSEK